MEGGRQVRQRGTRQSPAASPPTSPRQAAASSKKVSPPRSPRASVSGVSGGGSGKAHKSPPTSPRLKPFTSPPPPPRLPPSGASDVQLASAAKNGTGTETPSGRRRRGHEFRPRPSHFDRESFLNDRRGDLRGFLNLLVIALVMYMAVTAMHALRTGTEFHVRLFTTMSKDLAVLGVADLALVAFTFTAYLHQRLVMAGWLKSPLDVVMQHLQQAALFALAALFIYGRDWPWIQSGTLMMHAITLFMKMHSYTVTNRELAEHQRDAAEHPELHIDSPHTKASVQYPHNVTLRNYAEFLLVPTLVYEPEYPRTAKVRTSYLLEKAILCVGTITLLFLTVSHYIVPVLEQMAKLTLAESILMLVFPFMVAYLLVFYIIFECICNFMAELTRFADREFYQDWWNSTSFDEFSRKWNKPVHEWLLRHVYLETIVTYKASKLNATAATLLFSLLLHELALTVAGRRFRPYIMVMALFQLPLMPLMNHPRVKHSPLGNYFFWIGMLVGIPMLCVLYAREHYGMPPLELSVLTTFIGVCLAFLAFLAVINVLSSRRHQRSLAPLQSKQLETTRSAFSSAAQPVIVH